MRNLSHELIGVSVAVGLAKAADLSPAEAAAAAAGAFYGSRLPDVDRLGSRVHRCSRLERRSIAVRAAVALVRLPLIAFAALVSHRTVTHSAVVCVAVAASAGLVLAPLGPAVAATLAAGLGVGYAAHVLADACTPAGVQLWWPVSRRRVRLLPPGRRIATGSGGELLLVICTVALATAFVVA